MIECLHRVQFAQGEPFSVLVVIAVSIMLGFWSAPEDRE